MTVQPPNYAETRSERYESQLYNHDVPFDVTMLQENKRQAATKQRTKAATNKRKTTSFPWEKQKPGAHQQKMTPIISRWKQKEKQHTLVNINHRNSERSKETVNAIQGYTNPININPPHSPGG